MQNSFNLKLYFWDIYFRIQDDFSNVTNYKTGIVIILLLKILIVLSCKCEREEANFAEN